MHPSPLPAPTPVTRRRAFLALASTAVAPIILPTRARGLLAPSNRINLGMIGVGSMGLRHVKAFLTEPDCRIAAICDVDGIRRDAAAQEVNAAYANRDCLTYNDHRELIARPDIDAVCISVPDHWHAILSIDALRAGKDVYGEKPLSLTLRQGRRMVDAVRRHRRIFQTGSWQRSTRNFRHGCELVRNGRVGRLLRVEVGIGDGPITAPQPVMPVPPELDYERWLGPAAWAPYTKERVHWNFRWIAEYSGGQVTDWGAHHIDIAHWGMDKDRTGPIAVEGKASYPADGLWDTAVDYLFHCAYADGLALDVGSKKFLPQGVKFIGDRGWVMVCRNRLEAEPRHILREIIGPDELQLPRPTGDERQGHRRDFLDCIRSRAEPLTPAEIGHRSISVAHLANIAMSLGRKIRWDPLCESILDDETASRMLDRVPRAPYHE